MDEPQYARRSSHRIVADARLRNVGAALIAPHARYETLPQCAIHCRQHVNYFRVLRDVRFDVPDYSVPAVRHWVFPTSDGYPNGAILASDDGSCAEQHAHCS